MCGRFAQTYSKEHIINQLADPMVFQEPHPDPRWNIGPGTNVQAGIRHNNIWRWGAMHWGIRPKWLKRTLLNATYEKWARGGGYWANWKPCAVPICGFYEWKKTEEGTKQPWLFRPHTTTFFLAGLWRWDDTTHPRTAVLVLLTRAAGPIMAPIHHRQPLTLSSTQLNDWAITGVAPEDNPGFHAIRVSTHVNRIGQDGPDCWLPA